jgi:tetratricopeptide (TPR) repeat protein
MLFWLLSLAWSPQPLAPQATRGFEHFYNLEYEEALVIFREIAASNPQEPQNHNHVAQAILYRAMLKAGALESELVSGSNPFLRRERMNPTTEEQSSFDQAVQAAFARAEAQIARQPNHASAHYSLAVTYGLRANYNFLVRKAWYDALKDSTASRRHAQQAIDADPGYIDARLVLGLHDYIVGSLSWTYKMLGFLAGIHGDRDGGIQTLEQVAQQGINNRADARVLLSAIYRREKRSQKAVQLLDSLIRAYPRNFLFRIEYAQMLADIGERERALATLDAVAELQRQQSPGFARLQPEKIAYLRGNLLFWFDDYDRAVPELRRAVAARDHLDLNTGLMACLRLGQTLDLMGQRNAARQAYELADQLAPESELAKECHRYTHRPYKRKRIE